LGISRSLPSVLPAARDARRGLPSRGSRGSRCPTFTGTLRREDAPLPVSGRFTRRSLPDTGPAALRSCCPTRARGRVEAPRSRQGLWSPGPPIREWCTETGGSPTCPSYPSEDLPRSQPPVVSCALASVAHRMVAFRRVHTVGLSLDTAEAILLTTTLHIAGLHHAASLLAHSSCALPWLGWHVECAPDLLARLSSGGTCTPRFSPTGSQQPMSWSYLQSQGVGLPLARVRVGSAITRPIPPQNRT
jgi:hypothetical protein